MSTSQPLKQVVVGEPAMQGELAVASDAKALVLIVHADSLSRRDPGHRFIADVLRAHDLGTLAFSLRTPDEELARAPSPSVAEANARIGSVIEWIARRPALADRCVALFGMAGAVPGCVAAAAQGGSRIYSLVLQDGRFDLVGRELKRLRAPTLLIVGGTDPRRSALNRDAMKVMKCRHRLEVLPQATQPRAATGAHEAIACAAVAWLAQSPPPLATRSPLEAELSHP